MQSVPISNTVVSLHRVHGELYLKHYVIKFVSDLRRVGGFRQVLWFPPQIKLTPHDITEILLKVTLSTITLTHKKEFYKETVNSSLFTETSKQQSIYHRYSVVVEHPLFATNNQIGRKCNDPYKFIIIIRNSLRIPKVINSCYNCGTRMLILIKPWR